MAESSAHPPVPISPEAQAIVDREHLRLLEIVYYIAGGVTALFSCFFLIHFTMFLVFGLNPQMFPAPPHGAPGQPPAGMFLGFAGVIGVVILLGWTFGALQIFAGRCLRSRRNRTFILVVAGLECVFIPWGTAIGVCTIIALNRPGMRALFS